MLEAEKWMLEALKEASLGENEVPVGAVIVKDGRIIARAHNQRETHGPLAHAEMLAMERAFQSLGERRLHGCTLYVTLEPCPMCAGAMVMAELTGCVFGAFDARQGCCGSVYRLPEDPAFFHTVPCIGGVMEERCAALLQQFFQARR
ncbi:MAG: nucleoside deaminase [Clostridiales bacterium]|nr:nucleoside deaminase [Clostridiales bacterium]